MNNTIVIYSLLCFLILFICARISYRIKLVDLPNKRKIHSEATAFTGGIAISFSLILSIFLFRITDNNFNLILSTAFLISMIGLIDDKYNLNVGGKLSLQIFPIFYLIVFQGIELAYLGDYYYFEIKVGSFSIPLTLICALFLINAFNYFDGIDGTLSFTSITVLAILYFLVPDNEFKLFLILILIPILIFLIFNFSIFKIPKMFLGDSGSLLLGFIISFILIYLANQNTVHPILLAWSIVVFVYEFLSINIIRVRNSHNPFQASQDHLHHLLFRKTKSIFNTNLFISFLNIILFSIGYLSFSFLNSLTSLTLFILIFFIFLYFRTQFHESQNLN